MSRHLITSPLRPKAVSRDVWAGAGKTKSVAPGLCPTAAIDSKVFCCRKYSNRRKGDVLLSRVTGRIIADSARILMPRLSAAPL